MGDAHMKILGDALSHGDLDALEEKLDHSGIDRQESFRSTKGGRKRARKSSRGGSGGSASRRGLRSAEEGGAGDDDEGEPEPEWDLLDGASPFRLFLFPKCAQLHPPPPPPPPPPTSPRPCLYTTYEYKTHTNPTK